MGKTNPDASRHQQQSQILVPMETPGVEIVRHLPVFGFDDAPHGHSEVKLDNVRVPLNMLHKLSPDHCSQRLPLQYHQIDLIFQDF